MNIDHMTEEWVDAGQHSGQDILDLVKELKKERNKTRRLTREADRLGEMIGTYRKRLETLQRDNDFWQEEACKMGIAENGTADATYEEQIQEARSRMKLPTMTDARDGAHRSTKR